MVRAGERPPPTAIGFIHVGESDWPLPSFLLCLKGSDPSIDQLKWFKDERQSRSMVIIVSSENLKEIDNLLHKQSSENYRANGPQGSYMARRWDVDNKPIGYALTPKETKVIITKISSFEIPIKEKNVLDSILKYKFWDAVSENKNDEQPH